MSGYRHERAGVKWRCHGRTPELAASSRTTRIEGISTRIRRRIALEVMLA